MDKIEQVAPLTITFPLPPDELKVNRRMGQHWGIQHRLKDDYRMICRLLARQQCQDSLKVCRMTATVYLGHRQRCDPSDLGSWCKVPIDALVAEGILLTDSSACIRSFTAFVERDAENPRLEIKIWRPADLESGATEKALRSKRS